jgi:hypothetical protein
MSKIKLSIKPIDEKKIWNFFKREINLRNKIINII